jgi:hypothetical protein
VGVRSRDCEGCVTNDAKLCGQPLGGTVDGCCSGQAHKFDWAEFAAVAIAVRLWCVWCNAS